MSLAALLLTLVQAQGQGLVFPAGVDLVQVVVSVTTKQGRPLRDLEVKDFVVRDHGKAVTIETFLRMQDAEGAPRLPVEVALLLDTSSSMTGELARARDAIQAFVREVPSFARGRIVAFDREAYDRAFDASSVRPVLDQMIQMKGGPGTRVFDAVIDGAGLVSRQPGRRVMVLFTDGEDSTSERSLKDAVRALQAAEITCYVVSYSARLSAFNSARGANQNLVRDSQRAVEALAQGSGGFVVDGTSPDLVAELKRIADDIASSYVIGFTGALTPKVEHHRLRVEVARRDATVRHREGYETKAR